MAPILISGQSPGVINNEGKGEGGGGGWWRRKGCRHDLYQHERERYVRDRVREIDR